MKHLNEDQLILHYYGEAPDPGAIEFHLSSCADCRAGFEDLRRVLAVANALQVPARSESYGNEVWQRLQPRLSERRRWDWKPKFHVSRWAWAGLVTAMLVAAFFLGRFWPRPEIPVVKLPPGQVRERILLASVADHLDSSQRVLMEVVNASGNGSVDISQQQASAEELVAANRLYRQSAERAGEAGMAGVLEELERILLEIAHSPARLTSGELNEIRHRIDTQGILFKVRVIGYRARERQNTAARELARRNS
jgi:hypothetical protein